MSYIGDTYYLSQPIILVVVIFALAVIVLLGSKRDTGSWVFFWLLISMGLWGGLLFGMRASPDINRALLWEKALPVVSYFTFLLFYHFALAYTDNLRGVHKGLLVMAYVLLIITASISHTGLIIKDMRIEDYGYAPVISPLVYPLMIVTFLFIIGGGNLFIRRYIQSKSYEERNRIVLILIAVPFPLAGAILDAFSNLPPIAIWANLIFCAICSIALLRYHLLDVRVVARKGLAYILSTIIIALPYAVTLYIVQFFSKEYIQRWWLHVAIIVLFAVILRPVYDWAQRVVDRIFYRNRYNYLVALRDFARSSNNILDIKQISDSLTNLLTTALEASSACLLLIEENRDQYAITSCSQRSLTKTNEIVFGKNSLLIQWLEREGVVLTAKDVSVIPEFYGLTTSEREQIERLNGELYIPIRVKNNSLIGIIIVGEKLHNDIYSLEDLHLLSGLADQMVIVLENARLYSFERTMRRELEEQDKRKREFLNAVAHELKTPLTAILSSAELLENKSVLSGEIIQRLATNIKNSSEALNRRVGELMDLASDQVGKFTVKLESLDIADLINRVSRQLKFMFDRFEQRLLVEIEGPIPPVNADRDRMQQVLFNLLDNANKFSPRGSVIIIKVYQKGDRLIVSIKDMAKTISDIEKIRLFDPYYRGEDEDKRNRVTGLGLGLYIVKKIIELHQGKVWIENNIGKGNNFLLSLPVIRER
ncbi:ATP-binding protein [Chloroflexota bacterium]